MNDIETKIQLALDHLQQVKNEMQVIVNELNAEQDAYNKQDLHFLHFIEGADTTKEEFFDIVLKEKERRKDRRDTKNYLSLLINILKNLPPKPCEVLKNQNLIQDKKDTFYKFYYNNKI